MGPDVAQNISQGVALTISGKLFNSILLASSLSFFEFILLLLGLICVEVHSGNSDLLRLALLEVGAMHSSSSRDIVSNKQAASPGQSGSQSSSAISSKSLPSPPLGGRITTLSDSIRSSTSETASAIRV